MAISDSNSTTSVATSDSRERVVLLLDRSGSMNWYMPNSPELMLKIAAAVEGARTILQASDTSKTLYAVIGFDEEPLLYHEMSDDYLSLYSALGELTPRGETAMDKGITGSLALAPTPNRIILLSDGQPDSRERALDAARTAASLSVKIDTISIGDADDSLMSEIARITGGVFHRADSPEKLFHIFATLETENRLYITDGRSDEPIVL